MDIEGQNNKGDGVPLNAPNEEDQQDLIENQEGSLQNQLDGDSEGDNFDEASQKSENLNEKPSGASSNGNSADASTEKKTTDGHSDEKTKDHEDSEEKQDKPRFSGAARKRFKYYLSQGYSKEEAREKSLAGSKRSGSPDNTNSKKTRTIEDTITKVCIVLENYPDELLTVEQLKAVQESIMDRLLEVADETASKPKFLSSTHREGFLSIICADSATADWLKGITGTLKPWEGASLKALEDKDMPHPETYVVFLPDSKDYPDEKILKLLEAQNDTLNVSSWKVLKREAVDNELEVTFSIDRKFTKDLKKTGYKVSYKFGHVQLFPKDKKTASEASAAKDSKPEPKSSEWRSTQRPRDTRGPPPRSDWRRGHSSDWRGSKRGSSRGYQGSRARDSGSGGYSSNRGPGASYYASTWKPWS